MACLRCELVKAKLMILGMRGLGMLAAEMLEHLNAKLPGVYFLDRRPNWQKQNRIVFRQSPVEGGKCIEIAAWTEAEPNLNEAV